MCGIAGGSGASEGRHVCGITAEFSEGRHCFVLEFHHVGSSF